MGCWNGTCMISNLPILSGEKVKLVFLHRPYKDESIYKSAYCYPNGIFHPGAFALDGEYNDYGSVENIIEDLNFTLINKYFKDKYKKIKVEKEELSKFDLYNIIEGIERGSLELFDKEWLNKKSHYNFVMIREDIWNNICKEHKTEFWKEKEDQIGKDDYYQTAQEWVNKKFQKYKKYKENIFTRNSELLSFSNPLDMGGYAGGTNMFMQSLYFSKLDDSLDYFQKLFTESVIIDSFLGATRKGWMIVSGAGSQSSEWESYKLLNKIVENICNKQLTEYEE